MSGIATMPDEATYALRLGDDALILAQRLGECVGHGPELEEDLALANTALDLLGQARVLLTRAGELEGEGRDEDDLAFLREPGDFFNVRLVELPNVDFAHTVARQLFFSSYQLLLYDRLRDSADDVLSGVAAKAVKEVAYHRDHAEQWALRLGDGTEESHRRMQSALDSLYPHVGELFETDPLVERLGARGIAVLPPALRSAWDLYVAGVVAEATLELPQEPSWSAPGGRSGRHSEILGLLLAEMQVTHRAHPGAQW